ncbi:ribonuclease E inhibitor RraB [Kaarinaea lacus]
MFDPVGIIVAIVVAIFGYRYAAKKQESRTLDGHVIKKLEESGFDTTTEHELEFWFYADDATAVTNLAEELKNHMSHVHISDTEQDPRFVIRASKAMVPELSELQNLRKDFKGLAKKHNAVYDGWGCSIE